MPSRRRPHVAGREAIGRNCVLHLEEQVEQLTAQIALLRANQNQNHFHHLHPESGGDSATESGGENDIPLRRRREQEALEAAHSEVKVEEEFIILADSPFVENELEEALFDMNLPPYFDEDLDENSLILNDFPWVVSKYMQDVANPRVPLFESLLDESQNLIPKDPPIFPLSILRSEAHTKVIRYTPMSNKELGVICDGIGLRLMLYDNDVVDYLKLCSACDDDGGSMNPDKMRKCMSLGYSDKSNLADTIGQYGNGFKTSTMRLGADVIVFSRSPGKDEKRSTQSIGLLSYTFLRSTGKEDIVVPMLDYEEEGGDWVKIIRSSPADWDRNVETMVQWSSFYSEADLIRQLNLMSDHGTRIIIYNLWEDDQGLSELDFDADPHDIQLRGVNRDEKNINMGKEFPNSRHFLTYKHLLRSYASILYLRLPLDFRMILRGKDVEHHNIVNLRS